MIKLASRFALVGVLSVAVGLTSAGCFGSFALTKNIHKFNGEVSENQWMQELVFLVFIFLPVYGIGSLADAIIFNTVEFWTGDNPIGGGGEMAESRTIETEDGIAHLEHLSDGRVKVHVDAADGTTQDFFLQKDGDSVQAYDLDGKCLGTVGGVK